MIQQTNKQHEGKPVFQLGGMVCLSDRLTPAYCKGELIGYLREQSMALPRTRVELERDRWGMYRETGGVRWVGD